MSDVRDDGLSNRELLLEVRADVARLGEDMRERFHKMRGTWDALRLRVEALETHQRDAERRFHENDELAKKYVPVIDRLAQEDRIAVAVQGALFTRRQRVIATIGVACAVLGALTGVSAFVIGLLG